MCVCVCVCMLSCVQLFMTPWIVAHQAPLSMGYSRQEYWSELSCPPPGDLFDPRIETASPVLLHWQADALPLRDRYTDADVKIQTKMWVQIHR